MTINDQYALKLSGKNLVFPTGQEATGQAKSNLNRALTPSQLQRIRHDVSRWRESIDEAERQYFPFRVKQQRMYLDTVLNGHVEACLERRRDLSLLRKFDIKIGEAADVELTKWFKQRTWFKDFLTYAIDAIFYGYSLISLGDIVGDDFKRMEIVRRWHVSPDRFHVAGMFYSATGTPFNEAPFDMWHVYVDTPSESGVSPCGFGLLYKIGLYEILLRNTLGYNGDFVELYSQPYRVGKTTSTEEKERAELEAALQNMGSAGWALINPTDEIEFLESNLAGTGWKGYENLEMRCEKKISKMVLGHADALDSTPGKLGGGQDGEESPTAAALRDKQTKDGEFLEAIVNRELLPRMRDLGFAIPEGAAFCFRNDDEQANARKREDESNKVTAEVAGEMKKAGLKMDRQYFIDRTGIECEEIEDEPVIPPGGNIAQTKKVKAKLDEFYAQR